MADMGKVVFVCLHGVAKSVVAAELFKRIAAEAGVELRVSALGIEPDATVSPAAAAGLLAEGIDARGHRPRAMTAADVADATRVIAFGCDVGSAVPPGVPVEQWDDVPAVSDGYAAARHAIATRLPRLLERVREATRTAGGG